MNASVCELEAHVSQLVAPLIMITIIAVTVFYSRLRSKTLFGSVYSRAYTQYSELIKTEAGRKITRPYIHELPTLF